MSLTSPPLRQFKAEYYRIHYAPDVPEAEVLQPQQLWTTSSFLAIAKGAPPTDFRIRNWLLKDWEGLEKASLVVINHLDWFLSTVWKMVSTVEVEPHMRTDINNMLTSSSVAVNQLAHMQAGNVANLVGIATAEASCLVGVKRRVLTARFKEECYSQITAWLIVCSYQLKRPPNAGP